LLRLVGGAAVGASELLTGLRVDTARMRENIDRGGGLLMTESVAVRLAPALGRSQAYDLVARLSRDATERRLPLRDVLLASPQVSAHLSADDIDAALDPAAYLGAASEFIGRALATHADSASLAGLAAAKPAPAGADDGGCDG
jgi:3-carboxy-cis,cis-muconate cycloisomerase